MMNRPSLSSDPRSGALNQETPRQTSQEERPSGFWGRLWKLWLRLTSPHPGRFGGDLAGQERLRRSQLLSGLFLLVLAAIALILPGALVQPRLWISILLVAGFALLAAILNRTGQITLAGLTFVALIDASVTIPMLQSPTGLTNQTPAAFTLYLIAVLNAGVVLSRPWIVWTGILQIALIVADFILIRHDASLNQLIQASSGQSYSVLITPFLLIVCTTTIVWLYATSVQRTLRRAGQAEELAEARMRLHDQARQIAEQNQRLEQGIGTLQEVHARLSNGDYTARVNLQDNELLPLGVSLNILAERLGRAGRAQQDYQRLEEAIQQLVKACAALVRGNFPVVLSPTGTAVDQTAAFLTWVQQLVSHMAQGSTMAEDLQAALQHQEGYLSQAESTLFNLRSLVSSGASDAAERPSSYRTGSLGSTGPLGSSGQLSSSSPLNDRAAQDQQESALLRLRTVLEQERALCERLTQECAQARQLGRKCVQGTRLLSLQLKEGLGSKPAGGSGYL